MSAPWRQIHLFVASPSDVAAERECLKQVVDALNEQLADTIGLRLDLKEWRQVAPGLGRPEDVILERLPVETWDVFIGLFWLRFGTRPGKSSVVAQLESGTEEEFRLAQRAFHDTGKPSVWLYRCTRPAPLQQVNPRQFSKLDSDRFMRPGRVRSRPNVGIFLGRVLGRGIS